MQPGFCGLQIDAAHANLRESQFFGPQRHLIQQLVRIDRCLGSEVRIVSDAGRHPSIVESQAKSQNGAAGQAAGADTASLTWHSEADTESFATQLAATPAIRNCFIALHGELGAGKTSFVRHLLRALGVQGRIKSPTYAVVEPHEAGELAIWHFDFYRFTDPREWEDAGFRELFASPGLKLAEWPEHAAGALPVADLDMHIETQSDESRQVLLRAGTATGRHLLEQVRA